MNEPAVPAEPQKDWLAPPFENGRHYMEFIALDPGNRSRSEIAKKWLRTLTKAIRKYDQKHLITVGIFLINEQANHLPIGTTPEELAPEVDFLSVHVYLREGELGNALNVLKRLAIGKPVVIEEMGPLHCSVPSLERFIEGSKAYAFGWMGFYWGETLEEYKRSKEMQSMLMSGWLELFQSMLAAMKEKEGQEARESTN